MNKTTQAYTFTGDTFDYYKVPRVSQSLINRLGGSVMNASDETLRFGQLFHLASLEPDKYAGGTNFKIDAMKAAAYEHKLLGFFLRHERARKEWEYYFRCKRTGVKGKIKMDIWIPDAKIIADPKTTECKDLASFEQSVLDYNYDIQAAWYLDATGADLFYFFGIEKKYPFNVFMVKLHKSDPIIEKAREKYTYIIKKALEKGIIML